MRVAKRRRVGPGDPMAVVTRFLDAANHHDADTLYASVHPEFESFQPLHPDRNFRGPGQLISNWKAIFEAEPGFRLTVLRASTTGNTVWVELHGAGDSAEAAGIFIVGVENGRIRWVRVYSDLVEPAPEEEEDEESTEAAPGAVTGQPAVADPGDHPEPDGQLEPDGHAEPDSDSGGGPSGELRLVEAPAEPPTTAGDAPEATPDPALRLVDPTASRPEEDGGEWSDPEPRRVETLVGPSPDVAPPWWAPADEATPGDATPADEATPGDATPVEPPPDAPAPGHVATDAEVAGGDADVTDPLIGTDSEVGSGTDEPPPVDPQPKKVPDPVRPQSFEPTAPESALSRWRKAFRKF